MFEQLLAVRVREPSRDEILDELTWVLDRAVEHLGEERANRYLRKFYPWYIERLGGTRAEQKALQTTLQQAASLTDVRALLSSMRMVACAA
jgi:tRNA-dihydrouridine synthase